MECAVLGQVLVSRWACVGKVVIYVANHVPTVCIEAC